MWRIKKTRNISINVVVVVVVVMSIINENQNRIGVEIGQVRGGFTYLDRQPAWGIRTRVRMYSLNVECSSQIQNQMFSTSDHERNAVQSFENSSQV